MASVPALAQWPPATYETLSWKSTHEPGEGSRRDRQRHQGPYQAAIVPSIAGCELALPSEVLAEVEDAATEVARFDAEVGADVAPFSAILLRSESAASSQIENLTASARAIAEAELLPEGRSNAVEIVANTRAMAAAIALSDTFDAQAILTMHEALLETHDPNIAGKWRDQQVWIGGGSLGPHTATFVPPAHTRLADGISDLVSFIRRDDLPVLAHCAVAHAQFETLHPFPDGNGRTGRALVHSMLRGKGLTRAVTVPVSAGLLADVGAYFAALTSYREGDPSPIVREFSAAAFRAVTNGRQLVADLEDLRAQWREQVTARRNSGTWRVANLLLRQPVINAALVGQELGINPNNAYRLIEPLVTAGVLREATDRRRNRIWQCPQVLRVLDAFAARAGRRTAPRHPKK